MEEPLEETYFNWLCAKVSLNKGPMYLDLMRILHKTEFVWIIPGDRNRAEDGQELRLNFLREAFIKRNEAWLQDPCSILEFLIAFANRAYFQTDTSLNDWFWQFMTNLDLAEYRQVSESDMPVIEDILSTLVWRTYDPSGHGGMFPMRWPKDDQREVEIWYQFFAYLDDQGLD